jgi:hypothetical protein
MAFDTTQYRHPGVYVDAGATPTVAPTGVVPTVVCFIGNGVGYHTYSETVSFAAAATATLSQKGINPSSIKVTGYVTDPAASGQSIPYTFVKDEVGTTHDYSVATDTTAGADKSVTTITKSSGSKIETAYPQVTVTYQYTDENYHALNYFTDFASFTDTYGPAIDQTTGDLVSPLSFAAQVAIQNGVNQLYSIALNPAKGSLAAQFADAYSMLSGSNTSVNVVVPLWDSVTDASALAGMLQTLNSALVQDANNGVLRMAVVGFDSAYTGTPSAVATLASGIASKRIVMAWPNQLSYYNGVKNSTVAVDGIYLAAGYAGIMAAQDPEMPLTHKYVQGFTGIPTDVQRTLSPTAKDILAVGGVAVTEIDRLNRLRIRHGLTTDAAGGILTKEINLVRAQDALYNLLQDTMESSGLIGMPIGPTTALQVKSIASGALETAKAQGIVFDYNSLSVREQSPPTGDPTVIEVKFAYKPSWPLNFILVNFTVDTTNGTTDLTNASLTTGSSVTV